MSTQPHPAQIASHLAPEVWDKVNRLLVKKAISEYAPNGCWSPNGSAPPRRPALTATAWCWPTAMPNTSSTRS